jgi:hydroxymethylpyrimidine pyrophosphatase-like HAD family hydrolase
LQLVRKTKDNGAVFHLNSNRSIEGILKIRKDIDFNGRVIFENGIGIYDPVTSFTQSSDFKEFDKQELSDYLKMRCFDTCFTDTDKLAEQPEELSDKLNQEKTTVFCEQTRVYTATLYPRRLNKNKKIETANLGRLASILMDHYYRDFDIIENNVYDNILMVPKGAEKGAALREIAEGSKIASFGDEQSDISMFIQSDICGCPANATERTKKEVSKRGGMITTHPYTMGALQFIRYVTEKVR